MSRSALRRLALVAVVPTGVDIGLLVVLRQGLGWVLVAADLTAVAVASVVSYGLHRAVTFRSDPYARWVRMPVVFAAVATLAAVVDVAVLRAVFAASGFTTTPALVAAKGVAIAAAAGVRLVLYRSVLLSRVRRDIRERVARPAPPGELRATVIVPAFNEAARIAASVAAIRQAMGPVAADGGVEVVVVDDGSTDGTAAAALDAPADQVLVLPRNCGKGAAIRAGVEVARGRTVAFTDADLAYPPEDLVRVITAVEAGWDVAVGNRRHPDVRPGGGAGWLRGVGSRVINLLATAVLLSHPHDTQCGLKALRSDVARTVFSLGRIDRFAFDIELFHLVERHGFSLTDVPARPRATERSTVHLVRDTLRIVRDLARIRRLSSDGAYELRQ